MNVYDFDDTIYDGDSSFDFLLFLLKKKFSILYLLRISLAVIKYILKLFTKEQMKEVFYSIFQKFDNMKDVVNEFWDLNQTKIKRFYLDNKKIDDLIITASPEFLVSEMCSRLKIHCIGSIVDMNTGKYTGKNCYGEEKVTRLREYTDKNINAFYSDSLSDTPLKNLAEKSYIVKGDSIIKWE